MAQIHFTKSKVFKRIPDMIGKTYGYLTVLGFSHVSTKLVRDNRTKKLHPNQFYYVKCKCICKNEISVLFHALVKENTRSCGCVNGADKRRKYDPLEANAREAYVFYAKKNPGNLSFEQFKELAAMSCFYCGAAPSNITRGSVKRGFRYDNPFIYSGLDRRDNSLPHTYENCVPCCYNCNGAKSDKTEQQFLEWVDKIYLHQQKKKAK